MIKKGISFLPKRKKEYYRWGICILCNAKWGEKTPKHATVLLVTWWRGTQDMGSRYAYAREPRATVALWSNNAREDRGTNYDTHENKKRTTGPCEGPLLGDRDVLTNDIGLTRSLAFQKLYWNRKRSRRRKKMIGKKAVRGEVGPTFFLH